LTAESFNSYHLFECGVSFYALWGAIFESSFSIFDLWSQILELWPTAGCTQSFSPNPIPQKRSRNSTNLTTIQNPTNGGSPSVV